MGGLRAKGALALAATAISFTLVPAVVRADIEVLSQTRHVEFQWEDVEGSYQCVFFPCSVIDETITGDEDSDAASDHASFEADLGIVRMHSSELGSDGFSASASHGGSGFASLVSTGGGVFDLHTLSTTSRATHSVTFQVDVPVPYVLVATAETSGAGFLGSMLARIRLVGPSGQVLADLELVDDDQCVEIPCATLGPETIGASGTLYPGTYLLEAELDATAEPFVSITTGVAVWNDYSGAFQLTLRVPFEVPILASGQRLLLACGLLAVGALATAVRGARAIR